MNCMLRLFPFSLGLISLSVNLQMIFLQKESIRRIRRFQDSVNGENEQARRFHVTRTFLTLSAGMYTERRQ